ncbi:MAG: alpha-galactosidase [Clostridia bacterium]|nr:alpha-galactosidase [Clostridia bacterium]
MAEHIVNNLYINTKTSNPIKCEKITQTKFGEISEYKLYISFDKPVSPEEYVVSWEEDQIDMIGFWSSKTGLSHNISPDWWMREEQSRTASGMPLMAIYNKKNENRVTVALSDPLTPCSLRAGVVEENGKIQFQIVLFSKVCSVMKEYEVTIRIDRRPIMLYQGIKDVRRWWDELGYTGAKVPEASRKPLYSAWYSFHQRTIPEEILAECKIASEYGIESLIVDDGWQTDDNSRGYAYCGDWKICKNKIPDMKSFVDEVHKLGMKFIIWFSVPFVGFESENFEKFKGKYLKTNKRMNTCVLDPRFADVREFLVNTYASYVKEYGWDGLKLDFIDSFEQTEESSTDYENMDCISVEEGVRRLLSQVYEVLTEMNPEFIFEFRQSYVGPVVSQYGNMFRVGDCPNDALMNRVCSLDLRLTSGKSPVHSDMIMWSKNDTPQAVMYQLLATMFCVPQISIRFDNITDEHKKALKNHLKFWRSHMETILDGELEVYGIESNYTMARSTKDGESVAVLYQGVVIKVDEGCTSYIFNSTGDDCIYVESDKEMQYESFDIYGNSISSGALGKGVNKLAVENCGMVKLTV